MFWLLLSFSAFAQDELDLDAIQILDRELPVTQYSERPEDIEDRTFTPRYDHLYKKTRLKTILKSGTEHGHVKAGHYLIRLEDNKAVKLTESFFGKFYRLQDDLGFKYVQNNDGSCIYKLKSEFFNSIEKELELYVPPLKYTPAPLNIVRSDFDKRLKVVPEVTLRLGIAQGSYMNDLFNDEKAVNGTTNQYGINFATKWKLPIKTGLVFLYEKSKYYLSGGGNIEYSSPSFGPQFKTKDFDFWGAPYRFQTQLRVSPFARAIADTEQGDITFKFNSTDLMVAIERPVENKFGEFVFGVFFQSQWLNIKDQPETVKINSTNETNNSYGFSLAQVFE